MATENIPEVIRMKKRVPTFLIIIIIAAVMVTALVLFNSNLIFQEGNPLPVAAGIWQLVVGGEPYAKIKDEPATWMTRSGEGKHDELLSYIEASYGMKLIGPTDGAYVFQDDDKKVTVTVRQYSRNFRIWELES